MYPDNHNALDDLLQAKEAAKILDAENYGPEDEFILNKDPENQNITP